MNVRKSRSSETSRAALLVLTPCIVLGCATTQAAHTERLAPAAPVQQESTVATKSPDPAPEQPKLVPREALPRAAREVLSARMGRHSEELTFLLASVVLLDYPEVEMLAQMIAIEPKLGRPLPDEEDTLNALLPPAFFVHQDLLTKHAQNLVKAAQERSDSDLAKEFGALTETCVGCHAAYLGADFDDDSVGEEL